MLFHAPEFLVLLVLTLTLYHARPGARVAVLAVANVLFYAAAGWSYVLLFAAIALLTYGCSLRVRGPGGRAWLILGVAANLLNLGWFKYTGFILSNLDRLVNLGLDPAALRMVLPVGISFYTFQLIAYLVDVYRGHTPPARSVLSFWVFIAFFGQLIAGPIMRGAEFLPQIERPRPAADWDRLRRGAAWFLQGMAKKVLLADALAPRVDQLFAGAAGLGAVEAWIAAGLFGFQIYYDFSAYSDMALGIGHLFGYDLAQNFRTPYLAANPAEFWRRWHVTLSTWIRDYLYIPLGGSRRGAARTYANMLLAMALSGLWHGAAWTFVIWGLLHGVMAAAHRAWTRHALERLGWRPAGWPARWAPRWVVRWAPHWLARWAPHWLARWAGVGAMFAATSLGWVFFRAGSLADALHLSGRMLTLADLHLTRANAAALMTLAALYGLHVLEFWLHRRASDLAAAWRRRVPAPLRGLAYAAAVGVLLTAARPQLVTFIYFRF